MALYYPPLEWKYTEKIWRTHLKKLISSNLVEIDEEDILAYAETIFERQNAKESQIGPVWNGRQIRNAFQSAVALAGYKLESGKIKLEREHFERVSKVSNEFNRYIWSIKSQTDSDKASQWGYRFDPYRTGETIHMKAMQSDAGHGNVGFTFGQRLQPNTAQTGLPFINNPLHGFQQQAFPNNMAQPQGHFQVTPNATPGAIQSQHYQAMQGQLNQQPQQPYQQHSFQPFVNAPGNQPAQANVPLQEQYAMNNGSQGILGQQAAPSVAQT